MPPAQHDRTPGLVPKSAKTRNVEQYRLHHDRHPNYGRSSGVFLYDLYVLVKFELRRHGPEPFVILDFGCGKSTVAPDLELLFPGRVKAYRYDPAIPGLTDLPVAKADFVINTDVLEHLDEAETDLLIEDLAALSSRCFINIATRKAAAVLANGENAHATVRDSAWWMAKLRQHWSVFWTIYTVRKELTVTTFRPPLLARLALRSQGFRLRRTAVIKKRLARLKKKAR